MPAFASPSSPPVPSMSLPPRPYGVLVLGPHRAGTTIVASALGALGLGLPRLDDRPAGRTGGSEGRLESVSLTSLSDEILRRLGGSWDDPPPLPDPHSQTSEPPELLAPLRRAAATFEESFCAPAGPVCWTDPRTALVLPQWRRILEGVRPLSAVLCVREPLAAARSLDRATGLGLPVGLALWERYTRRAVEGLAGLPAFVSVFADALGDPERWQADLAGWLTSLEVRLPAGAEGGRRRGAPAARLSDEIAGEMGDAGAGGSDGGATGRRP